MRLGVRLMVMSFQLAFFSILCCLARYFVFILEQDLIFFWISVVNFTSTFFPSFVLSR